MSDAGTGHGQHGASTGDEGGESHAHDAAVIPAGIRFDEHGLVPVVVQEAGSNAVLLLAYMNAAALEATLRSGQAHFWSRLRGTLWRKGEQSGRVQLVEGLYVNCEQNSLLLRVRQQGEAACHTGYPTCYYRRLAPDGSWQIVEERIFDPAEVYGLTPPGS